MFSLQLSPPQFSPADGPLPFLPNTNANRQRHLPVLATALKGMHYNSYSRIRKSQVQEEETITITHHHKLHSNGELQSASEIILNKLLINLLVTADEFDLTSKLKEDFGLVLDTRTYSALLVFYCNKNEPIQAKCVLHHMLENGFHPNVATFTTLINSFCRGGRIHSAFEVFDVMSKIGCQPTINTYNCLLKGLCYVGRVEEAYDLLGNIKKSSLKLDIYTYTAVMDGLCKVGRSNEALELLEEAREMELTPNVVAYNTLFNGYFKEGRPLCGFGLLKRMKERNCRPDGISYSTLLHGLLKWGKTRAALQVYREMLEIGFQVDERMMNTLLRGLCRQSRKEEELLKDVYVVFEEMKKRELTIYHCAYDLVVEALINGKETDKAFAVLNEMVKIGFSPKTFTFNVVIGALCLTGDVDKALAIVVLIHKDRKHGRIPFNTLINELNQRGRILDARTVYGVALKRAMVPKKKPA